MPEDEALKLHIANLEQQVPTGRLPEPGRPAAALSRAAGGPHGEAAAALLEASAWVTV